MTGPARNPATTDDDERRWAEALALLDGTADEDARRRARRSRRVRVWSLLAGVLLLLVVGAVVVLLVVDRAALRSGGDPAAAQAVVGFGLSALGLLLMLVTLVLQFREMRRINGFRSPLYVLTRQQRRELRAQVRGRAPVRTEHVPLVRHFADLVLAQRMALATQVGLFVSQAGLWIGQPSTFRAWLVAIIGASVAGLAFATSREVRRARRFLAEHPADG